MAPQHSHAVNLLWEIVLAVYERLSCRCLSLQVHVGTFLLVPRRWNLILLSLVGSSCWNLLLVNANQQDHQWYIRREVDPIRGLKDAVPGNNSMQKFRDGVPVGRLRSHSPGSLRSTNCPKGLSTRRTTKSPSKNKGLLRSFICLVKGYLFRVCHVVGFVQWIHHCSGLGLAKTKGLVPCLEVSPGPLSSGRSWSLPSCRRLACNFACDCLLFPFWCRMPTPNTPHLWVTRCLPRESQL